ncbi:MAG TPA: hypothetical protein VID75_08740 [Acidimicrobiales bacterium]
MFRGQRRGTSSRGRWGTQSLSWATVGFLCAGALVLSGATPAAAKKTPHRAGPERAFTIPVEKSGVHAVCQPRQNKSCPTTNTTWAGYVVSPESGHQMTTVSASWVQKPVTCPKPDAWVLFWAGIDGWSQIGNATVEQGGSSAQCNPGQPVDYEAWWEMYPTNDVQTVFPIAVGDHISASVVFSSTDDTYTVSVADATNGHSFIVVASVPDNSYTIARNGGQPGQPISFASGQAGSVVCGPGSPCLNSSAEWIVEAPGGDGAGLYPLAHFKPTVFSSAFAADSVGDKGSITTNGWLSTALDLTTGSGTQEATVTPLSNQGHSFRVVWSRGQ